MYQRGDMSGLRHRVVAAASVLAAFLVAITSFVAFAVAAERSRQHQVVDFSLHNVAGDRVSLTELRADGDVLLLFGADLRTQTDWSALDSSWSTDLGHVVAVTQSDALPAVDAVAAAAACDATILRDPARVAAKSLAVPQQPGVYAVLIAADGTERRRGLLLADARR